MRPGLVMVDHKPNLPTVRRLVLDACTARLARVTVALKDAADTRQAIRDVTGESRGVVLLSLGRLKKAGEVEAIGNGKAVRYTLSDQSTVS